MGYNLIRDIHKFFRAMEAQDKWSLTRLFYDGRFLKLLEQLIALIIYTPEETFRIFRISYKQICGLL